MGDCLDVYVVGVRMFMRTRKNTIPVFVKFLAVDKPREMPTSGVNNSRQQYDH